MVDRMGILVGRVYAKSEFTKLYSSTFQYLDKILQEEALTFAATGTPRCFYPKIDSLFKLCHK